MSEKRDFEIVRDDTLKGITYTIKKDGKSEFWSNSSGWGVTATVYRKFADVEVDFNKLIKEIK